jgi:hypothetical protein
MLFADLFKRRELIDARVVDEDIETSVRFDGGIDNALCVGGLLDIAAHGDRVAAGLRNGGDDCISACLAGGVVDDDRRAFRGERFSNGRADTFRCAGYDGYFAGELGHD